MTRRIAKAGKRRYCEAPGQLCNTAEIPAMTAKLLDGKAIARDIRAGIKDRVAALRGRYGITPGLAVVLVGRNPASRLYVNNKIKACAEVGIRSALHEYPAEVDAGEIIDLIERLNADPAIHGILVQLPLPAAP